MAGRYSQWRKLRGDVDRPELVEYGKHLLAYLENQRELSGNQSAFIQRELPDGSIVMARFNGDQPELYVQAAPGGGVEDTVLLYIGSNQGLLIFDLNKKKLRKSVIGIENYQVGGVTPDGKIVHMCLGGGAYTVLRVDLNTVTAFSSPLIRQAFKLPNTYGAAGAQLADGVSATVFAVPSPDGKRVLAFASATADDGGVVKEGLGGVTLLNGETLQPVRGAIRMNVPQGQNGCWSPDSTAFYLVVTRMADNGDVAYVMADGESQPEGIAKFSADGVLLGTTGALLTTQYASGGFGAAFRGLHATNGTVFAVAGRRLTAMEPTPTLYAIDAATMTVRHSLAMPYDFFDSISASDDAVFVLTAKTLGASIREYRYSKDDGFTFVAVNDNDHTRLRETYRYRSLGNTIDLHPVKLVPPALTDKGEVTPEDKFVVTLPSLVGSTTQQHIRVRRLSSDPEGGTFKTTVLPLLDLNTAARSFNAPRNFALVRTRVRKAA